MELEMYPVPERTSWKEQTYWSSRTHIVCVRVQKIIYYRYTISIGHGSIGYARLDSTRIRYYLSSIRWLSILYNSFSPFFFFYLRFISTNILWYIWTTINCQTIIFLFRRVVYSISAIVYSKFYKRFLLNCV